MLIALLAVILLGSSWLLLSKLNASASELVAAKRERNAAVLNRAKQALVGYVAAQASKEFEENPGVLPCPEPGSYFGDAAQEGKAGSSCTGPIVGRFPWKTVGMDKTVDADGEPLWYVVSDGWVYRSKVNFPVINSNTAGQLTVDGAANAAVALIIAPGAAIGVTAASGCSAWQQVRPQTGTPDVRNYLECENATSPADASFITQGPAGSGFNDQVLVVTVADVMPGIEAAVSKRIETEIAPLLKSMYADNTWGTNVSATRPVYPFAASFGNPSTATYQGAALASGLLPMTYTTDYTRSGSTYTASACNPGTNPRCTPSSFITWGTPTVSKVSGSGTMSSASCTTTSTYAWCWAPYSGSVQLKYEDLILNIGNAMRERTGATMSYAEAWAYNNGSGSWTNLFSGTPTVSYTLKSDASFGTSFQATFPSYASGGWYYFYGTRNLAFADHQLLDTRYWTDAMYGGPEYYTGWFARNEWYRLVYYAVAPGFTPSNLPAQPACATGSTCLTVASLDPANPVGTTGAQRVLLLLAGRSVNGTTRPSSNLTDYLEFGNAINSYQRRRVSPQSVSVAYSDTGGANAYVIAATNVATSSPLNFRAASTNTGPSTLATGVTSALPIVNPDGTTLSAGQVTASGVVQVIYDGARFVLLPRPFNDRVVVVDSN